MPSIGTWVIELSRSLLLFSKQKKTSTLYQGENVLLILVLSTIVEKSFFIKFELLNVVCYSTFPYQS